jgi:hypothetical protein
MTNDTKKLITTYTLELRSLDVIKPHYFDKNFEILVGGRRHLIFLLPVYIAASSL